MLTRSATLAAALTFSAGAIATCDEVTFSDERTAWLFLKRVADDYTELLALREILSAHDDRDDMHRYSDDDVLSLIAGCLVRGSLKLKLQPSGGIA